MSAAGPLRVTYVLDEIAKPTAGTEQQLLLLLRRVDRTKVSPRVVVLRPSPFTDAWPLADVPLSTVGLARLASFGGAIAAARLGAILRATGADVVHVLLNDASLIVPPIAWTLGVPVVVARRDVGFLQTRAVRQIGKVSNRCVTRFAANSQAVRKAVVDGEGIAPGRVVVISNALDESRFEAPAQSLHSRLGISPHQPVIGVVANLHVWKRHSDVVRALATVREAGIPAHLVLLGEGPEEQRLLELARALDLTSCVHLLGRVTEPVPLVKALSVAVLASQSEGASNALLEYVACGVPAVASACDANIEVARAAPHVLTYPVADVPALARALLCVLRAPHAHRPPTDQTAAFIAAYGVETMCRSYAQLYAECLPNAVPAGVRL